LSQSINKNKVKIVVDSNSQTPIYMNLSEGIYIKHENDNFKNMFYIEEEKRGFEAEENHAVPGRYEIEINPEEEKEISFVCSLEENIEQIDVKQLIDKEIIRLGEIFNQSLLINNRKEKKTKEEIKNELFLLADELEELAINGKTADGNRVRIYVSNINFEATYSYVDTNNLQMSLIRIYSINSITTMDNEIFCTLKEWIQSLKKFSTLISESGEMQRIQFFKQQREIIDAL